MKPQRLLILFAFQLSLYSASAQVLRELTLDDAMNSSRIIQLSYPRVDLEALDQEQGMPYESRTTTLSSRQGGTHVGNFSLQFRNAQRVWRYATRGDYYLVNNTTGESRQLGADLPPQSLMFAKLSPDGSHVAYVSKNNIYIEDCSMSSPRRRQLTTDGNDSIINGTFDWVYEGRLP